MSQEPKKRHSRARQGKRRAAIKLEIPHFISCSNCGAQIIQHKVCPECGYYKGVKMLQLKTAKKS